MFHQRCLHVFLFPINNMGKLLMLALTSRMLARAQRWRSRRRWWRGCARCCRGSPSTAHPRARPRRWPLSRRRSWAAQGTRAPRPRRSLPPCSSPSPLASSGLPPSPMLRYRSGVFCSYLPWDRVPDGQICTAMRKEGKRFQKKAVCIPTCPILIGFDSA